MSKLCLVLVFAVTSLFASIEPVAKVAIRALEEAGASTSVVKSFSDDIAARVAKYGLDEAGRSLAKVAILARAVEQVRTAKLDTQAFVKSLAQAEEAKEYAINIEKIAMRDPNYSPRGMYKAFEMDKAAIKDAAVELEFIMSGLSDKAVETIAKSTESMEKVFTEADTLALQKMSALTAKKTGTPIFSSTCGNFSTGIESNVRLAARTAYNFIALKGSLATVEDRAASQIKGVVAGMVKVKDGDALAAKQATAELMEGVNSYKCIKGLDGHVKSNRLEATEPSCTIFALPEGANVNFPKAFALSACNG